MLFGIGGFEFVIIIVFALFIFGPDKLPELAKTFGKALRKFNTAKNEFETVVKTDILKPEDMRAVRDMQEDLQSITNAVKNPMSMLNTRPSETAQKVTDEVAAQREAEPQTDEQAAVEGAAAAQESGEQAAAAQESGEQSTTEQQSGAQTSDEQAVTPEQQTASRNEAEDIWAALENAPAKEEK